MFRQINSKTWDIQTTVCTLIQFFLANLLRLLYLHEAYDISFFEIVEYSIIYSIELRSCNFIYFCVFFKYLINSARSGTKLLHAYTSV